jgi:hypothetical protein
MHGAATSITPIVASLAAIASPFFSLRLVLRRYRGAL